ncbi:hypothetical protein BDN70DRAFT_886414 [Pholiota conissans]|uniref:Uncharacterized protein n=1 Tax=Pholiota conissans TaxID=109636 RepID=A0A9P6CNJ7_9AGAR|nr:hypothetical protein BDN70DRAFT_886414 [Pholiota conissans]
MAQEVSPESTSPRPTISPRSSIHVYGVKFWVLGFTKGTARHRTPDLSSSSSCASTLHFEWSAGSVGSTRVQ